MLVAAANLAARAAGIRPAMRLSEATALVDSQICEHDPQEDIDTLCNLAEEAQQFSPIVGLEQLDKKRWAGRTQLQPECLLLDVTGLAGLFGGEAALLDQVSQWLATKRYFGCLAMAGSVGAAWALANYGTRRLAPAPRSSPDACDSAARDSAACDSGTASETAPASAPLYQPPACRCVNLPAGEDWQAVSQLPLAALRLPEETIVALQRLGLRHIGELESLPRGGLATRLGDALLTRWDQAVGRQDEPIVTLHSSPDWSIEQTLEVPTEHRETIVELLRRASREMSQRLTRRGEGTLRLLCRLDWVECPPLVMQLGLFRPTNEAEHLELLLVGQLEQQLRQVRRASLRRLSLQATLTAPMIWRQADLFRAGEADTRHEIARLVDHLSCRLGRKRVLLAKTRREAQPELASVFYPLTGRRRDGAAQTTVRKLSSRLAKQRAEPSRDDPLRRPTHLLPQPVAIDVAGCWTPPTAAPACLPSPVSPQAPQVAAAQATPPVTSSHAALTLAAAPARFKYLNVWYTIVDARGPERLESGWWRGTSCRRDYYRVITDHGGWWWIYRDLAAGQWYLHGMFD